MPEWPEATRLAGERDTLGLYLTGHPIAQYESELTFLTSGRLGDLATGRPAGAVDGGRWQPGRSVTVAGLVLEVRKRANRVTLVLDDRSGRIEVLLYEETFQQHRDIIAKDEILLIEGQLRFDEFTEGWRLTAKRLNDIDTAREQQARRLILQWPVSGEAADAVRRLIDILKPFVGGSCSIQVNYRAAGASGALALDEQWLVRPAPELIEQLKRFVGAENLRIVYGARSSGDDGAASVGRSVN